MSEYNFVQIDNLYLTDDQTDTGMPCRVDIGNLAKFRMLKRTATVPIIEGPSQVQLFSQIGETFPMQISLLRTVDYEALLTLLNTAATNKTTNNIKIDGELGTFDLDCTLVSIDQPGEFRDNRVPKLSMVWSVAGIN